MTSSDTFHIYLSSGDSLDSFPDNEPGDFRVQLPQRVYLAEGKWWCGVAQLEIPENPKEPLYLCSNICMDSITGDFKLPVLRRIRGKVTQPTNVIYVPVKGRELSTIRIFIRSLRGEAVSFASQTSYCTLRFYRQ